MRRRDFLRQASGALAASALGSCGGTPDWRRLRLVHPAHAGTIERTALADAQTLLERATGAPVPIVGEEEPRGPLDVVVRAERSSRSKGGGFRISREGSGCLVAGGDGEVRATGSYRLLEHLGFVLSGRRIDSLPCGSRSYRPRGGRGAYFRPSRGHDLGQLSRSEAVLRLDVGL
jgi:hypothetical protein